MKFITKTYQWFVTLFILIRRLFLPKQKRENKSFKIWRKNSGVTLNYATKERIEGCSKEELIKGDIIISMSDNKMTNKFEITRVDYITDTTFKGEIKFVGYGGYDY